MLHAAIGGIMILVVWLALRFAVGAGSLRPDAALLLDGGIVVLGWLVLLILAARPILAALGILALAVGLGVVDRVKRAVLREPVLFADRAELLEIVRHPQLYLPFAGTWQVLAGVAAAAAAVAGLLALEPPAIPWSPLSLLAAPALFLVFLVGPTWPPLLRRLCRRYEALGPSRDPALDAAKFGLLATFVIHASLARAERPARQAALRPTREKASLAGETIVLVQAESLFDAERLHPGLGAQIMPHWHTLRASSLHGALDVPCWGANTIRTEFAVLAGVGEAALGLDRFNPYAALARAPIASLAWRARQAGFTTICVHPFDLGFYGRRHALPQLGFDRLIGPEEFRGAPRDGLYVSDRALAEKVAALLAANPGRLLVFAITMACHGPWNGPGRPENSVPLPPALAGGRESAALAQFLFRLHQTDAALPILTDALRQRPGRFVLGVYGDHQPSLPLAFAQAGLTDPRTDYLLWSNRAAAGARRDLAASDLGRAVLEAVA